MNKQITFMARDKKIEDILFANDIYRIPRYQRFYAWGEDQIVEFWNDLIVNEDRPFFIGSFIFNCEETAKTGWIGIIDGQQRLLTMTILAAVIRDLARNLDNTEAADRYQWFCIAKRHLSGEETFRIKCSDSLADYFEKYIQKTNDNIFESKPNTAEEKKVKNNYIYFYNRVFHEIDRYVNKSDKEDYLQKLIEAIAALLVIDIRIESEEDAYEIFETTNARGLELSIADLLKNTVFKNMVVKDGKDIAKEKWTDIINNVPPVATAPGTEMARFIRYYWISKYRFIAGKQLYREIKKEISRWDSFLADLHSASQDYNLIVEGNEADWDDIENGEKIYKSISALRIMRITQCNVLLLSIIRNLNKLGTNPLRTIQYLEKFSFVYSAVCGLPGNQVEKIYSKFALRIEETVKNSSEKRLPGNIQKILDEFEKELLDLKPSIEVFQESFNEISYKKSEPSRQLIKYILSEINELDESGEYRIDFNVVNIEHLLPQKPHKTWGVSKNEIKGYVNNLGNLTLIHEKLNSFASNAPIKEKIEHLRKSEIPMTQKLVKRLEDTNYIWNEDEILKRQKEMAEIAYYKVWNF